MAARRRRDRTTASRGEWMGADVSQDVSGGRAAGERRPPSAPPWPQTLSRDWVEIGRGIGCGIGRTGVAPARPSVCRGVGARGELVPADLAPRSGSRSRHGRLALIRIGTYVRC